MRYMGGPDSPWEGAILVDRGAHCKVYAYSVVSCTKTAEPIHLPFRLWTRVGRRMHRFNRIRHVAPMCPYRRTRCRHLSNNIKPSVYGNDAPCVKLPCYLWTRRRRQSHRQPRASSRVLYCGHSTQYNRLVLPCDFYLSSSSFFFFSSPNLSGRRLDVYHTSTRGVASVRIWNACLKCAARGSLKIQDAKKIAISAPSHNFVGPYLRN